MRTPLVFTVLLVIFLGACSSAPPEPEREQQGWFVPPEPTLDRFVVDGTSASGGPPPMELELVCGPDSNASTSWIEWSFTYPDGRSTGVYGTILTTDLNIERAGDLIVTCSLSNDTSYESTYTVEPAEGGFAGVNFDAAQEYGEVLSVRARCDPYGGVGNVTIELRFGDGEFEPAKKNWRGRNWDSARFEAPGTYEVSCRVIDEANNVFEETIEVEVVEAVAFDPELATMAIEPHERGGHCVVDGPVPDSIDVSIQHANGFSHRVAMPAYSRAHFFEKPGSDTYEVTCSASYGNVTLTAEETLD